MRIAQIRGLGKPNTFDIVRTPNHASRSAAMALTAYLVHRSQAVRERLPGLSLVGPGVAQPGRSGNFGLGIAALLVE